MHYSADRLIEMIKRYSFLPTAQRQFDSADLLSIADDVLLTRLGPLLLQCKENWFLEAWDIALESGVDRYDLPRWAMFEGLKTCWLEDAAKNISRLTRSDDVDLPFRGQTGTPGMPQTFYFEADQLVLVPPPSTNIAAGQTLKTKIYRRPNRLVLEAQAAVIYDINYGTGAVTYTDTAPAAFGEETYHDFFRPNSPFRRAVSGIQASALWSNIQTFDAEDVQDLRPGDVANLQDETIFPDLPIELHKPLADFVIAELMSAQMDQAAYMVKMTQLTDNARALAMGAGDRSDGNPKTVSLFHSPLARFLGPQGRRMVPR